MLVDYDIFVNVPRLDAQDAATVQKLYDARDLDFRLRRGSAAVDRGTVLPTVTDAFVGRAPDLGALESGASASHLRPSPVAIAAATSRTSVMRPVGIRRRFAHVAGRA